MEKEQDLFQEDLEFARCISILVAPACSQGGELVKRGDIIHVVFGDE